MLHCWVVLSNASLASHARVAKIIPHFRGVKHGVKHGANYSHAPSIAPPQIACSSVGSPLKAGLTKPFAFLPKAFLPLAVAGGVIATPASIPEPWYGSNGGAFLGAPFVGAGVPISPPASRVDTVANNLPTTLSPTALDLLPPPVLSQSTPGSTTPGPNQNNSPGNIFYGSGGPSFITPIPPPESNSPSGTPSLPVTTPGSSTPGEAQPVPEPSTIMMIVSFCAMMLVSKNKSLLKKIFIIKI